MDSTRPPKGRVGRHSPLRTWPCPQRILRIFTVHGWQFVEFSLGHVEGMSGTLAKGQAMRARPPPSTFFWDS